MDRAHRLGQTRTVNVYRLLMKDTVEEKVMSLQQFKLDVAAALVNQDNSSLQTMDTTQVGTGGGGGGGRGPHDVGFGRRGGWGGGRGT